MIFDLSANERKRVELAYNELKLIIGATGGPGLMALALLVAEMAAA